MNARTVEQHFSDSELTKYLQQVVSEGGSLLEGFNPAEFLPEFRKIIAAAIERAGYGDGSSAEVTDRAMSKIRAALYETEDVGLGDFIETENLGLLMIGRNVLVQRALTFVERHWQ